MAVAPTTESLLITVKEAAAILRVHTGTVYKLITHNEIPHLKLRGQRKYGRRAVRIPRKEFMCWVASQINGTSGH